MRRDTLAERYEEARVAFAETIAEPTDAHGSHGNETLRGFFAGFTDRWTRVHRYALAGLSDAQGREDAERDFQREAKLLLRRRQALVSACAQALARFAKEASADGDGKGEGEGEGERDRERDAQAARARVHAAIEAHDVRFEAIVQAELGRLRAELARAHEARRALGAYARTLQYRGE